MSEYIYLADLDSVLSEPPITGRGCNNNNNNNNNSTSKKKSVFQCKVSCKNVVAFAHDCSVYILPLEKPNELIPVVHSSSSSPSSSSSSALHECRHLSWSDDGNYLMVVYKNGLVNVYSNRTSCLNTVELVYSFEIEKSSVAVVKPFAKTPKLCFNYEKRDSLDYFEKFYYKTFNCLKNYSKFQYNGYLVLTHSGTLHICITDFNSVRSRFEKFEYDLNLAKVLPATNNEDMIHDQLDDDNNNNDNDDEDDRQSIEYDLADFCLETDGSINVLLTNSSHASSVYILKVNLKFSIDSNTIEGNTELLASLDISSSPQQLGNNKSSRIKKQRVVFTSNESAQTICVWLRSDASGNGNDGGSEDIIQIWKASALNPNSFIELAKETATGCTLLFQSVSPSGSHLLDLSVPKSFLEYRDFLSQTGTESMRNGGGGDSSSVTSSNNSSTSSLAPPLFLTVTNQNGTFGFLALNEFETANSISSQTMSFSSPIPNRANYADSAVKKQRLGQEFCLVMDQTHSGSLVVGITNSSRLVLARQPTCAHIHSSFLLFNMFEYSLLTGRDYWDLIAGMQSCSITRGTLESLIQLVEDKTVNAFPVSMQKVYYPKYRALLFSLFRMLNQTTRKQQHQHFVSTKYRPLEELCRLEMSRAMSVIGFSIQRSLDFEHVCTQHASLVTSKSSPGSQKEALVVKSSILSQQQAASDSSSSSSSQSFSSNLSKLVNDLLNEKINNGENSSSPAKFCTLNEIVSHVCQNKLYQLNINQQTKHIFQWILDLALYLTRIAPLSRLNQSNNNVSGGTNPGGPAASSATSSSSSSSKLSANLFGSGLLADLAFLKEIRKSIVYMKLLFVTAQNSSSQSIVLPILPLRSSVQKDLLSDLFNIYSKIILKTAEGSNILNDESIMDQCLNIEAEAVIRPIDELFCNLKHPWYSKQEQQHVYGGGVAKPVSFSIDEFFDQELAAQKTIYPIFDIVRMIQFSRSSNTKQCIRCGNFTEAQVIGSYGNKISGSIQATNKTNCIFVQDASSERCLCGGYWVLSALQ